MRDPYREYSEPWFTGHKVLRGGCHATTPALLRTSWRNFYSPDRRDVFAGFRTLRAMKKISSADNPRFKGLLRLMQSARERRNAGLSLLEGVHLVSAYREHVGPPEEVAVAASALDNTEIGGLLSALGSAPVIVLADGLFAQLSTVASPTGIVAAVRTPRALTAPGRLETCVMLEDIQDPGNLGSILRTAAAAGVRQQ